MNGCYYDDSEIEKAKDDFRFFNAGDYITKEMSNSKEKIFEYIEQLENETQALKQVHEYDVKMIDEVKGNAVKLYKEIDELKEDKQKLIEMLEKANKEDTESVKNYEKMRRSCQDDSFYKKSYQTQIHKLNAKRETRRNILSILK